MVSIIVNNQELFVENPIFKDKISMIFEPMVDFRRVGASVMGKKYYLASSKSQRLEFIQAFKIILCLIPTHPRWLSGEIRKL